MSSSTTLKGLAAVAASASLVLGGSGVAAAQTVIPGDGGGGRTVIVNNPNATLTIDNVDRQAGTATVTFVNNTGVSLRCEAPNQNPADRPGTAVSTAGVVENSATFYERYQWIPAGELTVPASFLGNITVRLWPLLQGLPTGSITQFMSDRAMLQAEIINGHDAARQAGLTGNSGAFTIANGATSVQSVNLNIPAFSPRGTDRLGVMTVCGPGGTQTTQQLYAWTAFEEGWEPPAPDNTGSLGSGSLGSLGSSGTDPVDPEPPIDDEDEDNGEGTTEE
ncbi:MAG: hypothetical protein ACK4UY_05685 [Dietzia sp.]